jgi:hypothetical protein
MKAVFSLAILGFASGHGGGKFSPVETKTFVREKIEDRCCVKDFEEFPFFTRALVQNLRTRHIFSRNSFFSQVPPPPSPPPILSTQAIMSTTSTTTTTIFGEEKTMLTAVF